MAKLILIFLSLFLSSFANGQTPELPLMIASPASGTLPVIKKQVSANTTSALTCTSSAVDMTGVTTIVIAVTFNISGSSWTNTITDSKGNIYSLATNDIYGLSFIYYCTGLTSANVSSTMTFTCATHNNYEGQGVFFTVYGLTGLSALDQHSSSSSGGSTSTVTSPSITPSYSGEFVVVSFGNIFYGPTSAMSGGFTLDQSISSGAFGNWNCQGHLITTSTSALSTTLSNGGDNYNSWGISIASFH